MAEINDRPKKIRNQNFIDEYAKKWRCLRRGNNQCMAFCTVCCSQFSVAHGGADDCRRHVDGPKHKKAALAAENTKSVSSYFETQNASSVVKAEALFTKFLTEHNIPIAVADHAGPLFKNMFPDSKIAAKYGAGKTKTSAMISVMANETSENLSSELKINPFSFSTDGSNDGRAETLYPIVIRYFDSARGEVISTLLCIASNEDSSTGSNIFSLIDKEFTKKAIPWENCVSFGCDNASVMTGKHKGVSKYIKDKHADVFIIGCYCHLIHLAAQKAAAKLPYPADELLIDIYYYLNKSTKRQQALKKFQALCGVEARKMIKHSVTRWLSLEKCIGRLLEQWEPLTEFFKSEKDPLSQKNDECSKFSLESSETSAAGADCVSVVKKNSLKRHLIEPVGESSKKQKFDECSRNGLKNRLERINVSLQDPQMKLYYLFLKNSLPVFTRINKLLMSSAPLIHKLKRILFDLLSDIFSRFIKSEAISAADDILSVNVEKKNHRENDTIVIGSDAKQFLNCLKSEEKINDDDLKFFYKKVKAFYVAAAKYIITKFNLTDPLLQCAEVADIALKNSVPFSHIEFFLSKFNHLFDESQFDVIETQFFRYQVDSFSEDILNCDRIDAAWHKISQLKDASGEYKYDILSKVMKLVLVIPHSNAEDERIFSIVKRNLTDYRPNLSTNLLSDIVVEKINTLSKNERCYDTKFSKDLLLKLKSAAYNSLHL